MMTKEDRIYIAWGTEEDGVLNYTSSEEEARATLNRIYGPTENGWVDVLSVEDIYDLVGMGGADPQTESEAREAYRTEGLRGLLNYLNAHYRG